MIDNNYYTLLKRYFYLKSNSIENAETVDVTNKITAIEANPVPLTQTPLDTAILNALESIGVYAIPAFIVNGKLGVSNKATYPACIYDMEFGDRPGDDGSNIRTIIFYMFINRASALSVLSDVNPKQEINTKKIYEFIKAMQSTRFNPTIIGNFNPMHDQTTVLEVGKEFKIEFSWIPC